MAALAADGIFDGTECAPRRFCPRQPVLRWHMAVWMVSIIDGRDPPGIESSPFADVDADLWWAPYVARLAELEITAGCQSDPTGPGRFCPDQPVSRARAAALLVRAFSLAPAPAPTPTPNPPRPAEELQIESSLGARTLPAAACGC